MQSLHKCPECGGLPEFEDGFVTYIHNSKTVFVVHVGECSLSMKTEYVDMASAIAGWNKSVGNWFEKNEHSVKNARNNKNVAKALWGGE